MEELIRFIACSLVDHPEHIQVITERRQKDTRYELRVAKKGLGRLIGKNGRVVKSIRSVVFAAATRKQERISLFIAEGNADGSA